MPPMLPVNLTDIILSVILGLAVLIPVAGLTARFAMKPVVETIARMRESQTTNQAVQMLERRMDLLEQEIQSIAGLRENVARLVEAQEFQLKLIAPGGAKQTAGE